MHVADCHICKIDDLDRSLVLSQRTWRNQKYESYIGFAKLTGTLPPELNDGNLHVNNNKLTGGIQSQFAQCELLPGRRFTPHWACGEEKHLPDFIPQCSWKLVCRIVTNMAFSFLQLNCDNLDFHKISLQVSCHLADRAHHYTKSDI